MHFMAPWAIFLNVDALKIEARNTRAFVKATMQNHYKKAYGSKFWMWGHTKKAKYAFGA